MIWNLTLAIQDLLDLNVKPKRGDTIVKQVLTLIVLEKFEKKHLTWCGS